MASRLSITTEEFGYDRGNEFNDITSAGDINSAVVGRIVVGYSTGIDSITVHYVGSQQPAVTRGSGGPKQAEIVLNEDEWITSVEGTGDSNSIASITFMSNKQRKWGPFGSVGKSQFVWSPVGKVPSYLLSQMEFVHFQGKCDNFVRQLKATFALHSIFDKTPVLLKYEKQEGDGRTGQSGDILSSFGRQLMSPIVILRIGPDYTQFCAHEEILCQLAFFRAALQGGFRESLDKTIIMADDEPRQIAALIEFLSTGSYTYASMPAGPVDAETPDNTDDSAGSADIPGRDISEGIFHAAVHATARKYDCENLAQSSRKNFVYALIKLDGIDVMRLWRAAYLNGVYLSQFETDHNVQFLTNGLHQLVGDAYSTDREEMEWIVSEDPALATDLLRLITTKTKV